MNKRKFNWTLLHYCAGACGVISATTHPERRETQAQRHRGRHGVFTRPVM